VYDFAIAATSPSRVAEKNMVWRSVGIRRTMAATCGRKPCPACDRLVQDQDLHPVEADQLAPGQVVEPPGRRDQDVGLTDGLRLCGDGHAAVRGRRAQALGPATSAISSATWTASSRVGTSTKAAGGGLRVEALHDRNTEGQGLAGPGGRFRQDVVPAMPSGTTIAWTAVGVTMFRRASTPMTDVATPSWGKDVCCICFVLLAAFRGHGQSGREPSPETA